MILNAYAIYDRKSLQYHPPFYASTDASAARSFADLANDNNTQVGRHPSDFVLYSVGQWDDAKGTLLPLAPLRHVADATALVKPSAMADLFTRQGASPSAPLKDGKDL